ncbi:hypothetical protein OOK58_00535 [Streptomyces sp. NBC_01728]|uniref:hypothetical protein n=1 Tax=unclassified Streptomyces TaxID=2593676 RepID=UPI00224D5480|nr:MULTISPECIES: hypothetical protein [unclassified Streptomyces]MCX4461208.1 hypothetical protein [Streptomyces sp. NBC_01719]MCX4490116.1 hypothetical protein [Streptomyces sp. NBC_01728]
MLVDVAELVELDRFLGQNDWHVRVLIAEDGGLYQPCIPHHLGLLVSNPHHPARLSGSSRAPMLSGT